MPFSAPPQGTGTTVEALPLVAADSSDRSGIVTNLQRFSVGDGPGIRSTLFLKGCNLRCRWCHNPETLRPQPQLQYDAASCIHCGACVAACAQAGTGVASVTGNAIVKSATSHLAGPCQLGDSAHNDTCNSAPPSQYCAQQMRDGKHQLDWARCTNCLACVPVCPSGALSTVGYRIGAGEACKQLLRDQAFFQKSGGGVTLSGGEPLLQPDFCAAVFAGLQAAGVHTALDTAGNLPWASFQTVLPQLSLVLFDLKLGTDACHKQMTGADNARIRENFARLLAAGTPLWVRVPVMADLNDGTEPDAAESAESIRFLADALRAPGTKNHQLQKIQLLPYHSYGLGKYEALGYRPAEDRDGWNVPSTKPDAVLPGPSAPAQSKNKSPSSEKPPQPHTFATPSTAQMQALLAAYHHAGLDMAEIG